MPTALSTEAFLRTVITTDTGYLCMAIGNNEQTWRELWYHWPDDIDDIIEAADTLKQDTNVYFSSHLFKARSSIKENVLPTRTIQADLDEADIDELPLEPTVMVQTSPKRHQAYWVLADEVDLETHEILSRRITYAIKNCDRSGWPLGHKVRLPNTINYKYLEGPKPVTVVAISQQEYDAGYVELLPEPPSLSSEAIDSDFLTQPKPVAIAPLELLESLKADIPTECYFDYERVAEDRSLALWKLMCAAFRANLNRDEVFHLAKHSANNKFANLRFNGDRELAKDVLRAEAVVSSGAEDPRETIDNIRKLAGTTHEKRQHMLETVWDILLQHGKMLHTAEDHTFYVRNDVGRPILIAEHSEYLTALLDMEFGMNSIETDTRYVTSGLCTKAKSVKTMAIVAALTYYDPDDEALYLHTGRRDVLRITKTAMNVVSDGSYDLLFPWNNSFQPFKLDFGPLPNDTDWGEILFGDAANHTVGISRASTVAVLKVWLLFLFFRSDAVSRPILALFGQPGSGKSTTFRKLYALLYGKNRSLSAVTTAEDFDYAVSTDPLVVLDNVDTWERWLPDRFALAASTSDITKRKFYSNFDTVIIKRQSLLGISAHNPKFGREDVTDRLLIINLKRIDKFIPEGPIINNVLKLRPKLLGAIVRDAQRVLNEPEPDQDDLPQLRVEDFARVGYRIACALGIRDEFVAGVENVRNAQKAFALDEDYVLVEAIRRVIARDIKADRVGEFRPPGQWWLLLEAQSDEKLFKELYHNATTLGKKFWALYDALRTAFDVEYRLDTTTKTRVWAFCPKPAVDDTSNNSTELQHVGNTQQTNTH